MRRTFDFNPSSLEMAEEFATWNSEDQAAFLEHVRRIFAGWGGKQSLVETREVPTPKGGKIDG